LSGLRGSERSHGKEVQEVQEHEFAVEEAGAGSLMAEFLRYFLLKNFGSSIEKVYILRRV